MNWVPEKPKVKIFNFLDWKLIIYSLSFSRGEVFYIELLHNSRYDSTQKVEHSLYYKNINKWIPINKKNFGFNTIYVFPPELNQSKNYFEWYIKINNIVYKKDIVLDIQLRKYLSSKNIIFLEKKKLTPEEELEIEERVKKEKSIKKMVFSEVLPNQFTNSLSHPRDYHYLTSEWFKKRKYQYYTMLNRKKIFFEPFESIHKGLDLKGKIGDLIFALADGKIVLSDNFYYEGNFIVINHGNSIFSIYMHMDQRFYRSGTYIKSGTPIGTVGSTGLATGPHLHFALWIDGYNADPLSILSLPIR